MHALKPTNKTYHYLLYIYIHAQPIEQTRILFSMDVVKADASSYSNSLFVIDRTFNVPFFVYSIEEKERNKLGYKPV